MTQLQTLDADRLWERLQTLGAIGRTDNGGLNRITGSRADQRARDQLIDWFDAAGLTVRIDPVGNLLAIRPGRTDKAPIITGSHIDTVPNGGMFDGAAGVLAGLEIIEAWNDAEIRTDRPVGVIVFTEEEGTRFNVGLLGSAVASGRIDRQEALALTDDEGQSVQAVLDEIGYHGHDRIDLETAAGLIELHVEQGRTLEREECPVGIVDSIVGITTQTISFTGSANHAGTTAMDERQDAFAGAAAFSLAVEQTVSQTDGPTVGTVGEVHVSPNGSNVVPGDVRLGVDIRDPEADRLRQVREQLKRRAESIGTERGLDVEWTTHHNVQPRSMDDRIQAELTRAADTVGIETRQMRSGAGHDAMNAAPVVPTGMVFVPSKGGVSHSPAEFTAKEDLFAGTIVLEQTLRQLVGGEQAD